MLFAQLITLKGYVIFFSGHLIIYFLAENIKSVKHMLGLRYHSVQSSVLTLLNTGALMLSTDAHLPTPHNSIVLGYKLQRWMS